MKFVRLLKSIKPGNKKNHKGSKKLKKHAFFVIRHNFNYVWAEFIFSIITHFIAI